MKKALTKLLFTAVTLVILAAIIPLSANASTSNKAEVYRVLTQKLKFNSAAACGIMANIERESDFDPTLIIVDSNGLLSGGLCQWNGGRFQNLQNYCYNYGLDYESIEGQLSYLSWEMKTDSYGYIFDYLYDVPNTSEGAYDAAYYWCYYYERPSSAYYKASQRGEMARDSYWPKYGKVDLKAPKLAIKNKKTPYDIDNSIAFKWSNAGDDVSRYYLLIAAKNSKGKYDWSKAKIGKYNSSVTAKTIGGKTLKSGDYAACVRAYNADSGKIINSNYATFSVECLSHNYVVKVTKQATLTSQGVKVGTCSQCGKKVTKKIPVLTPQTFNTYRPNAMKIAGYNDNKISFKWNKITGVDGYSILQKINGKWKVIDTLMSADQTSYITSSMKAGSRYAFCYRPFIIKNDNVYWSGYSYGTIAATRPSTPQIKSIIAGDDSCQLKWSKVSGADGYAIYYSVGKGSTKYQRLTLLDKNTVSYNAKNLKSGQYYNFAVKSYIKTTDGYAISRPTAIKTVVVK